MGKKIGKFRKAINGKAHQIDHPGYQINNGQNESLLSEPVPEYFARPGDGILTAADLYGQDGVAGKDNNAAIIFGRDRTGLGEVDKPGETDSLGIGSYGDYMGAGAIDIVVGRMAPFPIQIKGKSISPLFNTQYSLPITHELSGSLPEEVTADHPEYAMDAARIYISQMTNVDYNFDISEALTHEEEWDNEHPEYQPGPPSSAIVLKSDKVRIHAREDVKIVTGGFNETVNSQGEPIMARGGIHLIAQNEEGTQQPIPLGDNLEACFEEIVSVLNNISNTIKRFAETQMNYNHAISKHWHISTPSVPTTFDVVLAPLGTSTVVQQFTIC